MRPRGLRRPRRRQCCLHCFVSSGLHTAAAVAAAAVDTAVRDDIAGTVPAVGGDIAHMAPEDIPQVVVGHTVVEEDSHGADVEVEEDTQPAAVEEEQRNIRPVAAVEEADSHGAGELVEEDSQPAPNRVLAGILPVAVQEEEDNSPRAVDSRQRAAEGTLASEEPAVAAVYSGAEEYDNQPSLMLLPVAPAAALEPLVAASEPQAVELALEPASEPLVPARSRAPLPASEPEDLSRLSRPLTSRQ